jgi:hypothetical protein
VELTDHISPSLGLVRGTPTVTDRDLSGEDTEAFFASPGLQLTLIRQACNDEKTPGISRTGCASASRRSSGR